MKTQMQLVSVMFAVLLFGACSKDDESTDESKRVRVTPALLRAPSCDDTTGEGGFETWSLTEDSLMFYLGTVIQPPSLFVPGYASDFQIHNRRFSAAAPQIDWTAFIEARAGFNMDFALVDRASGMIEAYAWEFVGMSGVDSISRRKSFLTAIKPVVPLTPGCKRLYFNGHLPSERGRAVTTIRGSDILTVLFKGHFDVEVY